MYLLIKPASGACDLGCRYCFYADEMSRRSEAARGIMKKETAAAILGKALARCSEAGRREPLSIGFQGGEPLLAGIDFFRFVCSFVEENNNRRIPVSFFIQTNGTHVGPAFAELFDEKNFLVGLSMDGPKEYHDKCRVTRDGKSCFSAVQRAAVELRRAGAEFNTLTVVTSFTASHAQRLYSFFARSGLRWQQYIPCVAPLGDDGADALGLGLSAEQYGEFLCRMFDLWYEDALRGGASYVYNRDFENWIGILAGRPPEECGMCGVCSVQYLIESDGSVYPCDFYALDAYCLGNLLTDSFDDIDRARERIGFIEASRALPAECAECRWLNLCRNGCRRNRVGGEPAPACGFDFPGGKNRFCESYRRFFEYAYPRMRSMADLIVRRAGVQE